MACDARMMDADARAATVQTIAGHMEDALEIQREVRTAQRIPSIVLEMSVTIFDWLLSIEKIRLI